MIKSKSNIKLSNLPLNWKSKEQFYTGDYLKATTIAEKLYDEANKLKIQVKNIHLKAEGLSAFSAIFIVKKQDFIADKFRNVFTSARKLKNEIETEDFYINFSFLPLTKGLKEKNIISDGYFLKYEKNSEIIKQGHFLKK